MPIFRWDDSYSVSVKKFDTQHKQLAALLNQLKAAVVAEEARENVHALIEKLCAHTAEHFACEEAMMKRTEFAELDQHSREHKKLLAQLNDFSAKHQKGHAKLDLNLLIQLRDWLVTHIGETDKRYGAHLNNCGID